MAEEVEQAPSEDGDTGRSMLSGSTSIGIGLGVTAAASYAYLVVSARVLGIDQFSDLSVLWSYTFLIGGVLLPFEQEISRLIVVRRVGGGGARSVILRGLVVGAVVVAAVIGGLALAVLLGLKPFAGNPVLALGLLLAPIGYLVANFTEGVLAGHQLFVRYGTYLGTEAVLRLLFCLTVLALGARTAGPVGLALGIAPVLAMVLLVWGRRDLVAPGPVVPWRELSGGLAALLFGSLLSQTLINVPPILVNYYAGEQQKAAAGIFTAALIVARIPTFLWNAVQAVLLPRLSTLAVEQRFTELKAIVRRLAGGVAVVIVLATVGAALIGPAVIERVFGDAFTITSRSVGLLALAAGGYVMATALALVIIALGAPRHALVGWLAGAVTIFTVAALGSDPIERVSLAFAASTIVASIVMALMLQLRLRAGSKLATGHVIEALTDISSEV